MLPKQWKLGKNTVVVVLSLSLSLSLSFPSHFAPLNSELCVFAPRFYFVPLRLCDLLCSAFLRSCARQSIDLPLTIPRHRPCSALQSTTTTNPLPMQQQLQTERHFLPFCSLFLRLPFFFPLSSPPFSSFVSVGGEGEEGEPPQSIMCEPKNP